MAACAPARPALFDARIGYRFNEVWHAQLDIFNLFNSHAHQIDYFYASQLPGEASPPTTSTSSRSSRYRRA